MESKSFLVALTILMVLKDKVSSGEVIEVRSMQEWDRRIIRNNNGTLSVVQFSVPWCGYCRYMKPEFVKLAARHQDVIFLNVDADQQQNLAWRMGIRSVPTYKYFKNGRNVDSITTWRPSVINDLINRLKN